MAPDVTTYELRDPAFPVAELLVGEAAGELGARAVHELAELELQAIAPRQIAYRPGVTIRVLYEVTVAYPDGAVRTEDLVAFTSADGPPDGALVLESAAGPVAFWRYPWDPRLPGLEVAWEKNSLLGMLEAAGAKLHALPTLRNLSYSPGTHAVIEIQLAPEPRRLLRRAAPAEAETLYLKVMQPSEVEHVQRAHVELLDVLPVPQCLAWSANLGVLLMDAVTGETVWERVIDRQPLPGPEVFIEILDRLAATVLPGDVVATTGSQAVTSGEILKATVPEEAGRVDELVAYCADEEDQPLTTVHGDFHENQVLLGDEGVTGIVDLDEVGPGHRVDDMAMLVGRLWASAPLDAERSADFERYALELFEGFARRLGSGRELHRRCAAVMVGRATNPFRFTSATWREETIAGLDLAERWLREGPR